MVKILGISASPRHQATDLAVKLALEEAAKFEGVETEFLSLKGKNLHPCIHCDACFRKKCACILKDDVAEILEKFTQADGIILGSPVYTYNPTPELLILFNRMRPLRFTHPDALDNKVGGAIAIGGTRNGGQEYTLNSMINLMLAREIMVVGGSMGNYAGGKIWTQNKGAEGAEEDVIGLATARDIGYRVAKAAVRMHRD